MRNIVGKEQESHPAEDLKVPSKQELETEPPEEVFFSDDVIEEELE